MIARSPQVRGAIFIAILWAIGVGLVVRTGNEHGMVPEAIRATLPCEWRGVLFVAAEISIESLALFWLLFRMTSRSESTRTLIALALFIAMSLGGIMTTVTDMPGWFYVNTPWMLLVVLLLAVRSIAQAVAAAIARSRAPRA